MVRALARRPLCAPNQRDSPMPTATKPRVTAKTSVERLLTILGGRYACEEGLDWLKTQASASAGEAWAACHRPDWMIWALNALGVADELKLRRFAVWCVRETPLGDGRKVWDLLTDERSRAAVA